VSAAAGPDRRGRAPFGRRRGTVVGARDLGAYRVFTIAEALARAPRPLAGQFYMLAAAHDWGGRGDERPFLARAFSVARAHELDGQLALDFLIENVGPGTERLSELSPGDQAWFTGPLGIGFTAPPAGRMALLAGGGVGIAPLAIWQDQLLAQDRQSIALLGFRDGEHAAGADLLVDPAVATEDASVGRPGLVTELLTDELAERPDAVVYACGPPGMLEAVRALCAARGVSAQLALESGMACGFGACFGCVVALRDGSYLRLCTEGPVVDAARLETALAPGHPRRPLSGHPQRAIGALP
jgi:dihydroorotate dehydrogenase electron transfer subunit